MSRLEALVEIDFDSGKRRYATTGISSGDKYWEPRLVSIGDINRQISVLPENFRASDFTVTLADSDQAISKLKNEEPFRRRKVEVLLGEMDQGESDFEVVAAGVIESWSSKDGKFTVRVTDESIDWLDEVVAGFTTDTETFEFLPNTTGLHLVPILIGDASATGGALPAYLIDAATGQAGRYRYVCAHGDIKSIDKVYKYGTALASSAYTVRTAYYRSQLFKVLDFTTDQRNTARPDEIEITWDGKGWTDTGASSGNSLTNPADQFEAFLKSQSVGVDSSSFTAAATSFSNRSITGALILVDLNETLRQVIRQVAKSYNLTAYTHPSGNLAVTAAGEFRTVPSNPVELDAALNIGRGGFSIKSSQKLATEMFYRYSYNGVRQEYDNSATYRDEFEEVMIGEQVRLNEDLPYIRHISSATAILEDKLFFLRERRAIINIGVDPDVARDVEVGDIIRVSHFAGLGESGYEKELMRVIGVGISFRRGNYVGKITCVDITQKGQEFVAGWRRYWDYSVPGTYTTLPGFGSFQFDRGPRLRSVASLGQ